MASINVTNLRNHSYYIGQRKIKQSNVSNNKDENTQNRQAIKPTVLLNDSFGDTSLTIYFIHFTTILYGNRLFEQL